ncbi:MAG: SMP-30/gluconolactonase/LRE family protein [Rhizobiaceae bacterium]|nr:SMP-30/gluconolactonase/LRE family protein [Rhizobiaceae bacterium]
MLTVTPLTADLFSAAPKELLHHGDQSAWAKMTRPGEHIHSFIEGPSFDRVGDLWLADVAYGKLFSVDARGKWTLRFQYDGEPHAAKVISDRLVMVPDYSKGLLAFDPGAGTISPLPGAERSSAFHGLSDIVAHDNHYWVTDSGRSSLSAPYGQLFSGVIGQPPELLLDRLPYPNGIALSPDGKSLFVAMTRDNAIWKMKTNGAEKPPMVGRFIRLSGGLGPDGLAVSSDGHLAVAQAQAGRAYVYSPVGDLVARIDTDRGTSTTSVAFDAYDNLYIVEAQNAEIFICRKDNWAS